MDENTNEPKSGKLTSLGHMLLGLVALPFLILAAPIAMGRLLLSLWRSIWEECFKNPKIYLTDANLRNRITYTNEVRSAGQDEAATYMQTIQKLVAARDWVSFGTLVKDWDQTRKKTVTNYPLADMAVDKALSLIAGDTGMDDCAAVAVSPISDDTLDRLETATTLHPQLYPLAVLTAELHMRKAWHLRGGGFANEVPEAAWEQMDVSFQRANWLLETNDPTDQNAPLLASAHFHLCDHLDATLAAKRLHKAYQTWCALDPQDMRPHGTYAFKMLPRWYGTYADLDMALRKAMSAGGPKAYTAGYLNVALDDDGALVQMDAELFVEGLNDLVLFRGRDPAHVSWLIQTLYDIGENVKALGRRRGLPAPLKSKLESDLDILQSANRSLARKHLVGLNPRFWEDGIDGALGYISVLFQRELREGALFSITPEGLEVTSAEQI